MFIPKIYKSEDASLMIKIISENAFALLISDKEKLSATHSMFLLNDNEGAFYLETHISKANFQAKVLKDGEYEKVQKCPMFVENMGEEFVRKEMKGAFGINIIPTEIYIANKLSQNRNDKDFENIILNLEQSDFDNNKKIAELMKQDRNLI